MIKKIFIFILFVFFTNCSGPGTAFLGPTFTGVKTGSVYQTSLSYGSGKAMNVLKSSVNKSIIEVEKFSLTNNSEYKNYEIDLVDLPNLLAVKIDDIEISEPTIEEPLP